MSYRKHAGSDDVKIAGVPCPVCGTLMIIAGCCFAHDGDHGFDVRARLTEKDSWIIALDNLLLFVEESLDYTENEHVLEEFISRCILALGYYVNTSKVTNSQSFLRETELYSLNSRIAKKRIKMLLRGVSLFSNTIGVVQVKKNTVMLGNKFFPVWSCCFGEYMSIRYVGIICEKCGCEVQQRDHVTDKEILNFFTRNQFPRNFNVYNQMKRDGITGGWNFFGRIEKRHEEIGSHFVQLNPYDCNLDLKLTSLVLNLSYLIKS